MARREPDLSKVRTESLFEVRGDEGGVRLDVFLKSRVPWRSREHLQERIREGHVLVNGAPAKASTSLRPRDEVLVALDRIGVDYDPSTIPLPVIHEDDLIVAIDKPAGFVVHPVGRHQMDTIINALHHRYRRPDDPENDVVPKLAHRLDQHTSGVLLVAKRDDVRAELGRQFAYREIEKEYLAIVTGVPSPARGHCEAPIGRNPDSRNGLPMLVRDDGEPSLTLYEVEEDLGDHALVRLRPMSGRTHQIRVHMQYVGHPLVADAMYGGGDPLVIGGEEIIARYPLHSASLTFTHPGTGERQTITAPLPEDMEAALRALRAR